ncbi:MAG: dihydroorotase [Desulfurococcaceae archaeon]
MASLLVKGGLVVSTAGVHKLDIRIVDGVISEIGRDLPSEGMQEVINAQGNYVFPGIIDEHVHMREPGLEYKDDFEHGSKAAIKGGVTTVIDHPNTLPPVESEKNLVYKGKVLESKAYADFALIGVLHDSNIHEFENMLSAGAVGFKVFMGPTTGNIPPPSDPTLYEIMWKSAKTNTRVMFHAEDFGLITYFSDKARKANSLDPSIHDYARPPIAEVYSIVKISLLAKYTGGRAHIVHVSSLDALEYIKQFKNLGVDITSETCPHYLLLDKDAYSKYGTLIKANPPIRGGIHRKALMDAVINGSIETIGSDHAPHTPEEKDKSVWEASSGFAGVQTLFPLIFDTAMKGLIPLTKIPELLSEAPAKLFKLWPWKGSIMPGSSGDLVIVDPNEDFEITPEWLEYKYKISPFIGWRLRGKVKHVVLRGELVVLNGELTGRKIGKWVKPVS